MPTGTMHAPLRPHSLRTPISGWPQDTITGLLLAGTGHINEKGKKNFLVVDSSEYACVVKLHNVIGLRLMIQSPGLL